MATRPRTPPLSLNDNDARLAQIANGGYTTATVKSFNTEWNSAYSGQGGNPGDANFRHGQPLERRLHPQGRQITFRQEPGRYGAADVFSYWALSDIFDESGGPSGSYILGRGGALPFGGVFGLMTFQGVRKAAFNAFKMLSYLGPRRLMSGGGTGGDGVDAMATTSATGDELQILVYNFFATLNTTGSDDVTVTVSNLPAALAGKEVFVTHFRVDETHSNPYSVWVSQGSPTNPTEDTVASDAPGAAPRAAPAGQQGDRQRHLHRELHHAEAGRIAARRRAETPADWPQRVRGDRRRRLRRPIGRDEGEQQRHDRGAIDCR